MLLIDNIKAKINKPSNERELRKAIEKGMKMLRKGRYKRTVLKRINSVPKRLRIVKERGISSNGGKKYIFHYIYIYIYIYIYYHTVNLQRFGKVNIGK